ncbi:MAG: hypothetical protein AAB590_02650 [Patescibacteria group bacterium]
MFFCSYPKIIIKYARALDPIFIEYCKSYKHGGWDKWVSPSHEEVIQRTENYNKEWAIWQEQIVGDIQKVLGLNFKRTIIDVHIVSGNPRNFSNPIIIKSGYPVDEFIDVLSHELIHVLLQDNNNIASWECVDFVKSLYPNETKLTQDHLIVHATLKCIYLDTLEQQDRFKKNLKRSSQASMNDYYVAWEIINQLDHKQFISDYKKWYRKAGDKK